jgi:xylulokinase
MIQYLLAHDLGTSGNKATLFTTEGKMVDSIVHPYPVHWSLGCHAEQDASDWYKAVCESTKKIIKKAKHGEIIGVSFSGQMMGCLCVDELGNPLSNAIIWADTRAIEEEAFIKTKFDEFEFYKITGHRPSASNTLAKLLWVKRHHPEQYEKTYKVLNAKDFILQKLTGAYVTDYSDASGTNLLDLNTMFWSEEIANKVGIDLAKMPKLVKSTDVVGLVTKLAAKETGLRAGTPIICGGGDGSMAAVGACCIEEGTAFGSIGTSAWNASTTTDPLFDPKMTITNFAHIVPERFVLCGAMQTAGAALSWIVKEVAHYEEILASKTETTVYDIINEMVERTSIGAQGLIFLPYLLGERSPRWNGNARACFIGLGMTTERKEIFRAVYEGIAMNLEIILATIKKDQDLRHIIMTGGGVKSKVWCQIFADVFNLEIHVPNYIEEATSIGAAVTAGVGLGVFKDFSVIHDFVTIEEVYKPIPENVQRYNDLKPLFEEAYQSLTGVFDGLDDFNSTLGK